MTANLILFCGILTVTNNCLLFCNFRLNAVTSSVEVNLVLMFTSECLVFKLRLELPHKSAKHMSLYGGDGGEWT